MIHEKPKRNYRIFSLVLAFIMALSGVYTADLSVSAATVTEAISTMENETDIMSAPEIEVDVMPTAETAVEHTVNINGASQGIELDCTANSSFGFGRTLHEWFGNQGDFFRITTGDCTAYEASNPCISPKKIEAVQVEYRPDISMGSLCNGVFTPYRSYWNPGTTGTYKAWRALRGSDGVYYMDDSACITFQAIVSYSAEIAIEVEGGGAVPAGARVLIDDEQYANGQSAYLQNGTNYTVSATNVPGYKIKSIPQTTVTGKKGQTIKVIYEPATACEYEVVTSDNGTLTVDGKSGTFAGAVGVESQIQVWAKKGAYGANVYANKIKGIYVNGEKLANVSFPYGDIMATASYTPSATGTYKVEVEYEVNKLIADTGKILICENTRSNETAQEIFNALYGESLKAMPEANRPVISGNSITYLAGQRYKHGVGNLNWVNYDCWLKFSDSLPANYKGLFGDADRFHDTSNPKPHLFGELGDGSSEQIRIFIPASGAFGATMVQHSIRVSTNGLKVENASVVKGDDVYDQMVRGIHATFRGNASSAIIYTDTAGNTIDQNYLMQTTSERLQVVVTYPGDDAYYATSKTVTVTLIPELDVQLADTAAIEKTYDGEAISFSTINGEIFKWTDRESASEEAVSVIYYDSEGKQLDSAPVDVGNYTARLQVTDSYGTEISGDSVALRIQQADAVLELGAVPAKTYGDEPFTLEVSKMIGEADATSITYTSGNEAVATVDENGQVTILSAGTAEITATLPETENYNEAMATTLIVVNKAMPVVNIAQVPTKTYGEENFSLDVTVEKSDADYKLNYYSDDYSVAAPEWVRETGYTANNIALVGAGTATITVTIDETANYKAGEFTVTFDVVRAEGTVEIQNADKVYDRSAPNIVITTNNTGGQVIKEYKKQGEDDSAYTMTAPTTVGDYVVRVTVLENKQYLEASVTGEFTISPKELSVNDVDFADSSRHYDGTNVAELSAVGLAGMCYQMNDRSYEVTWDDVAVDLSKALATVESSAPGYYYTVSLENLELTGEDAGNYTIVSHCNFVLNQYYSDDYFYIGKKIIELSVEDQTVAVDDVFTDENGYVQNGKYIVDGETVAASDIIDQTKYVLDENDLVAGHKVASVTLSVENRTIIPTVVITDADGNDVTDNYYLLGNLGMMTAVVNCDDHAFREDGFCDNCVNYQPAEGYRDEWGEITYDIYNAGQLFWFAQQVNEVDATASARLMADIDLNPGFTFASDGTYTGEGAPRGWTPIGYTEIEEDFASRYAGDFDGQGHTISGIYYVNDAVSRVGLFGQQGYNEVKDLHLTNSYIKGTEYVGAIAGMCDANLTNCTVDSSVTVVGSNWVGGFAGYASNCSYITNCASTANVSTTGENTNYAGLVAHSSAFISNCYCASNILVGVQNTSYGRITNSFYLGTEDEEEEYEGTTAVTAEQFASGMVAYLLQAGQVGEQEWDAELGEMVEVSAPKHFWGQNVDLNMDLDGDGNVDSDPYPVMHGVKVYYGYTDCQDDTVSYSNAELNEKQYEHSYDDTWMQNEEGHWQECSVCGEPTETEGHFYSEEWSYDDENHWHGCVCGLQQDSESHTFSEELVYDNEAHWYECECGAKSGVDTHTLSEEMKYDDESHWYECECGAKVDVGTHNFGEEWAYNTWNHWHMCADCGMITDDGAHTSADSACTAGGICTICEQTYGDESAHEYGEITYTWSEDYTACTATRVCVNDASHVNTVNAVVTSKTTVRATCTTAGEKIYTATFENEAFETQTKKVEISERGHAYCNLMKEETKKTDGEDADAEIYFKSCSICGHIGEETFEKGNVLADVKEKWQVSVSQFVYDKGIMNGKNTDENGNVTFAPGDWLTRPEFAQILYSIEGRPNYTTEKSFVDVDESLWYAKPVLWAAETGIVAGVGEGKFGVTENITREQLAVMLYKYARMSGYDVTGRAELDKFSDADKASSWALTALEWAVDNGILNGKGTGDDVVLDPGANATRAECAAMLRSFLVLFEQ